MPVHRIQDNVENWNIFLSSIFLSFLARHFTNASSEFMIDMPRPPQTPNALLRCVDANRFAYLDLDRALFDKELRAFVPPNAFDVHAHLYDLRHLVSESSL